jgi:integrase
MIKQMLLKDQRVNGTRRHLIIINPAQFESFFTALRNCTELNLELKTFIAVSMSGGCRLSEALSIQKHKIDLVSGFIKIRVLKKRERIRGSKGLLIDAAKVTREFKLHPIAQALLNDYLAGRSIQNYQRIFNLAPSTIKAAIVRVFGKGACNHSIARHSYISYLLHHKHFSVEAVAKLMCIGERVIASYNHLNVRETLDSVFEVAA